MKNLRPLSRVLRQIELRHLRYFLAVADARSFTQAAEDLGVTQPTLSHQIKQLETIVDAVLIDRRSRTAELTESGRLFRPFCERLLRELELGGVALTELKGLMRGHLRIAVSHSFSTSTLPNVLADFARRYPGVHVAARVIPHLDMQRALVAGDLDVAVAWMPERTEDIVAEPLSEELLMLVVGSRHPWVERRSVTMQALAGIPLVLLTREFAARQFVDKVLGDIGSSAGILLEMNAIAPILAVVRDANFATVLSSGSVPDKRGLSLIKLTQPVPRRTLAILWRRDGQRSPAAERMASMIRAAYGIASG
jgi:LysR family transcriptional regulator, cyn operon transcriptional activator